MAKDFVKLRKIPGLSQDLTQIQANIDVALSEIQSEPPMRGVLIKGISLTSGQDTVINHTLGRAYQGFIVAGLSADARIWYSSTSNVQPSTQLILTTNASCVASVWVF